MHLLCFICAIIKIDMADNNVKEYINAVTGFVHFLCNLGFFCCKLANCMVLFLIIAFGWYDGCEHDGYDWI